MDIEINIYETKKIANRMIENAMMLNTNIKRLYGVLDKIEVAWNGIDATFFLKTMRDQNMGILVQLQKMIYDYGFYLEKVSNVYATCDEVYTSKVIE